MFLINQEMLVINEAGLYRFNPLNQVYVFNELVGNKK